jgi:hypothetical protein
MDIETVKNMEQQKKKAAAIAAVMRYLRDEEDAACAMAASGAPAFAQPAAPQAPVNTWGISGRQSMMQLRTLMQMKSFHNFR